MLGIVLSILSLAKLFDYLLVEYPAHTWAYFFGLVLASVYYIGLKVKHWDWKIIATLIIGALVAMTVSFVSPSATENTLFLYFHLWINWNMWYDTTRLIRFLYFDADGKLSSIDGKIY